MGRKFQVSTDKLVSVQGVWVKPPFVDRDMGKGFQVSTDKLVPIHVGWV